MTVLCVAISDFKQVSKPHFCQLPHECKPTFAALIAWNAEFAVLLPEYTYRMAAQTAVLLVLFGVTVQSMCTQSMSV